MHSICMLVCIHNIYEHVYIHNTHKCLCMCVYPKCKGHEATGTMSSLFLPSRHVLSGRSGHWRPLELIRLVSKMVAGGGKRREGKPEARLCGGGLEVGLCDGPSVTYMQPTAGAHALQC